MKRSLMMVGIPLLLLVSSAALAEDLHVKQASAVLRAGKGAAYDEVATLKKGAKVTVIAREGKWLKVSADGRTGYLFEAAVADSKSGDTGGLSKLLGGAAGASEASSAEAGKGLGESIAWARANRMSPRGLERMIAIRKTVTGQDWESFTEEGRVGPAKP